LLHRYPQWYGQRALTGIRLFTSRALGSAIVGLIAVCAVATAVAAAPQAGKSYSGHGQDYLNNGPHWETVKALSEPISFKVSKTGQDVLRFRGKYYYYCGAGTGTLTAGQVSIRSNGSFSGTGKRIDRVSGKVQGTDYFALKGQFLKGGKARVTYLFDFVGKGVKVSNPYSFKYRGSSSCLSRVTGTVKAG
jgi:hypothetical protein